MPDSWFFPSMHSLGNDARERLCARMPPQDQIAPSAERMHLRTNQVLESRLELKRSRGAVHMSIAGGYMIFHKSGEHLIVLRAGCEVHGSPWA